MRRIVPSPIPLAIVEIAAIELLLDAGSTVVCVGGGGMPVYRMDDGRLEGIDAVVDKDLASKVLATALGADDLVILTELERVAIDYKKPGQRWLDRMTVDEARAFAADGQFPAGSMGPKVTACVEFLEAGGKRAIITNPERMTEAFEGRAGTLLTR
jgi:carbamate kinase